MDSVPDTPSTGPTNHSHYAEETIEEEEEEEEEQRLPTLNTQMRMPALTVETATPTEHSSVDDESDYFQDEILPRPRLQRISSHESIMSLTGGLDIHTLKSRPSQMTLRPLGGVEAIVTGVVARPTLSRSLAKRSDAALRDNFAGFQTPRSASNPSGLQGSFSPPLTQGKLGKWVGWRPWGGGSSPNTGSSPVFKAERKATDKDKDKELHRSPGINQPGAIPGFQQYWSLQQRKGAPAQVTAETIDHDALMEVLQE
jgi:hypothetical protein